MGGAAAAMLHSPDEARAVLASVRLTRRLPFTANAVEGLSAEENAPMVVGVLPGVEAYSPELRKRLAQALQKKSEKVEGTYLLIGIRKPTIL